MWPFKKSVPKEDVVCDGVPVRYAKHSEQWEFALEGIDFVIDGDALDPRAVSWARDALPVLTAKGGEMLRAAKDGLSEWKEEIDLDAAELLSVDLSEFAENRYLVVAYAGDDSWGDMGVDVTLQDGKILAVDAGD